MTTSKGSTKNPPTSQQGAGAMTAIAILTAQVLIIILNLRPYAQLLITAAALAFAFNLSPWIAYPLGAILLMGIQSAEVRPILMTNPSVEQYERVKWLSLLAYVLDLALAILAWPIVKDFPRWWVTKSLAEINYAHLAMIVATVYGFSFLTQQLKNIYKDLKTA